MKCLKLLIIAAMLLSLAIAKPASATHDSKISGYKWNDQNADGIWDIGEPPLEGWTINLGGTNQWGDPVNMTTETDAAGYYEFYPENGLWAGNYIVSEVLIPGWIQSYPAPPGTHVIALGSHQHSADNNFGNYQSAIAIELTKTATESYSKAGDVVHYTITVNNTSPEGAPDLECTITDPMLGINEQVTLAWDAPDYVINADYTVLAGDPDPLVNTVTVMYSPVDSITVFTVTDSASVDLLHPAFTLTKNCVEEPVPFGEDAIFEVTLANTGDVDLVVMLDEDVVDTLGVIVTAGGTISSGAQFTLPVGQTLEAIVAVPATTYPIESNTINAHITLPEWTGLDNSWDPTASDSCDVEYNITPGFTLTKECAEEPVLLGDDAIFIIELANTGNVELIVVLDEDVVDILGVIVTAGGTILAGDEFTLPVGQTLEAIVAVPATTYPLESNTINALITLPEWTGRTDSWNPTATDSCYVIIPCSKETAYGLNDALNPVCFNTLGFDNWGWTHGPVAYDGVYTFELWAGAAQCNLDNGAYAGTITIVYTGKGNTGYEIISYDLEEGFEIIEEHVYIGEDQLPQVKDGKKTIPTVSPGQYYVTKGMKNDIYIIYHAVVESCD